VTSAQPRTQVRVVTGARGIDLDLTDFLLTSGGPEVDSEAFHRKLKSAIGAAQRTNKKQRFRAPIRLPATVSLSRLIHIPRVRAFVRITKYISPQLPPRPRKTRANRNLSLDRPRRSSLYSFLFCSMGTVGLAVFGTAFESHRCGLLTCDRETATRILFLGSAAQGKSCATVLGIGLAITHPRDETTMRGTEHNPHWQLRWFVGSFFSVQLRHPHNWSFGFGRKNAPLPITVAKEEHREWTRPIVCDDTNVASGSGSSDVADSKPSRRIGCQPIMNHCSKRPS